MLTFQNVTKKFGGVVAVYDVSFTCKKGTVTSLVGPNGAGKTTLITVTAGQMRPTDGQVTVDDTLISGSDAHSIARHGVARTFQHSRLVPELTAKDNVIVGALHTERGVTMKLGKAAKRAESHAEIALEQTGIAHLSDTLVSELSYGQMRMVELARALARKPKVLLLDEPAAGLNPQETTKLGTIIRQAAETNDLAVMLVEHDLQLVRRISDQMVVLNFGQMIAQGAPDEVCANPAVIEAYIGSAND